MYLASEKGYEITAERVVAVLSVVRALQGGANGGTTRPVRLSTLSLHFGGGGNFPPARAVCDHLADHSLLDTKTLSRGGRTEWAYTLTKFGMEVLDNIWRPSASETEMTGFIGGTRNRKLFRSPTTPVLWGGSPSD